MSHALSRTGYEMSADQFFDWPGDGTGRSYQLIDGEPVLMAPPSNYHGLLQGQLAVIIGSHLRVRRPDCRVLVGPGVRPRPDMDLNVRVPDLAVACGVAAGKYLPNPLLIVEILSPSNARETREAVRAMLSVPSLREVLIVGSEAVVAEVYTKDADGVWPAKPQVVGAGQLLRLASIDLDLAMDEVYAGLF